MTVFLQIFPKNLMSPECSKDFIGIVPVFELFVELI